MALATPLRLRHLLTAPPTAHDPAGTVAQRAFPLHCRNGRLLRANLAATPPLSSVGARAGVATAGAGAGAGGRPTVLVTEKLGPVGLEPLRAFANMDCAYELTAEELRAKVSLVDALVVRSATRVTREVFEAARGRLRVVGRAGVGIDNVVNAPTANTIASAEHAV